MIRSSKSISGIWGEMDLLEWMDIERLKARNIDSDSGIHTLVFRDPKTPQSM